MSTEADMDVVPRQNVLFRRESGFTSDHKTDASINATADAWLNLMPSKSSYSSVVFQNLTSAKGEMASSKSKTRSDISYLPPSDCKSPSANNQYTRSQSFTRCTVSYDLYPYPHLLCLR